MNSLLLGVVRYSYDVAVDEVADQNRMGHCSWAVGSVFSWTFALIVGWLPIGGIFVWCAMLNRDQRERYRCIGEERLVREMIKLDLEGKDLEEAWYQKCRSLRIYPRTLDREHTLRNWVTYYG
jgi:hypothetical protein